MSKIHPYEGLSDQRGSLTRYPAEICTLPYHWVKEYTELGGSFDSKGSYGIRPNDTVCQNYSPTFICKILNQANGRWDRVPWLGEIIKYGIPIHETADLEHLRVFETAVDFIYDCVTKFGFHPIKDLGKSPFFCARMENENIEKIINFCFSNGKRICEYICDEYNYNPAPYDEIVPSINKKLYSDLVKGAERLKIKKIMLNHGLSNVEVPQKKIELIKKVMQKKSKTLAIDYIFKNIKKYKDAFENIYICANGKTYIIYYMEGIPYVIIDCEQQLIITEPQKIQNFYYIAFKNCYAIWQESDFKLTFFSSKKEEIINILTPIILTMENCYSAGLCFSGVMNILQKYYPEIHQEFAAYKVYDEIPHELLTKQYMLPNRIHVMSYPEIAKR